MPLPKPRDGQTQDEFIQMCMGETVMVEDFPDQGQRFAICRTQWEAGKNREVRMECKTVRFELKDSSP